MKTTRTKKSQRTPFTAAPNRATRRRPTTQASSGLAAEINASPRMATQRKQLEGAFGPPVQLGRKKGVGNAGKKRQGKKGQRDKKHGLMLHKVHGGAFTKWLHLKKQKSNRRDDFNAEEIKKLQIEYLKEKGLYEEVEIPPQPNRYEFPPDEDESEGDASIPVG